MLKTNLRYAIKKKEENSSGTLKKSGNCGKEDNAMKGLQ